MDDTREASWARRWLRRFFYWLGRVWLRLFYRVEVRGLENLQKAGARAVIVSNHESYLDGQLIGSFVSGDLSFAVNTHVAGRGLLARLATKVFDIITVDPGNAMALRSLIRKVAQGRRVVIFPEGRVTLTSGLMKIYDGPAVIAHKAGAPLVPARIEGASKARLFTRLPPGKARLRWFPKITLTFLEPVRLDPPAELSGPALRRWLGDALYDLMAEAAFTTAPWRRHLMEAFLDARKENGGKRLVLEDINREPLSYDRIAIGAHVLGGELKAMTRGETTLGVLLPTSAGCLVTLLGLLTNGRVPAMLNFSTGALNMAAACKAASVKTIVTSRRFVEQGGLEDVIAVLERDCRIIWLEEVRERLGAAAKIRGLIRARLGRAGLKIAGADLDPDGAAVILFTSGSEGVPKGVVLSHANLLANAHQVLSIVDFNTSDLIFNALPMFHALGLSAGVFLPLVAGSRLFLYPSPLHYKVIPELVYETSATVFFATDTFLAGYARNAHPYDFYNVRYVVAGAERVREETRRTWMNRFGLRIYEGYGATETSPVLAVNTPMHFKAGTVGRLLPAIKWRIEPVEGIEDGGRLVVKGPNVMKGYLRADEPGVLEPPEEGWYDTGDIVAMDDEGYVTIKGRAKRFAKVGGEMVALPGVEMILGRIWPDHDHAVVAVPDRKKGEKLVLITTLADLSRRELAKRMKEEGAADIAVPREIMTVEELPVLGSGKTDYVTLQDMARQAA